MQLYLIYFRLVATEFVKFHAVKPEEVLPDEAGALSKEPRMFKDIEHFLRLLPEDFREITYQNRSQSLAGTLALQLLNFSSKCINITLFNSFP